MALEKTCLNFLHLHTFSRMPLAGADVEEWVAKTEPAHSKIRRFHRRRTYKKSRGRPPRSWLQTLLFRVLLKVLYFRVALTARILLTALYVRVLLTVLHFKILLIVQSFRLLLTVVRFRLLLTAQCVGVFFTNLCTRSVSQVCDIIQNFLTPAIPFQVFTCRA